MTTAVVTLARGRRDHLERQAAAVAALDPGPDAYVLVSMDDTTTPAPPAVTHTVALPVAEGAPLPLAAARNAGIAAAAGLGVDLVICLDADCLPEHTTLAAYARAAREPGGDRCLLAGPVGRLDALTPDVLLPAPDVLARSRDAARRGPRPIPPEGTAVDEPRIELFWSLSFAVTVALHEAIGGFDERYEGYGAEDTDYAFRARRAGVGLRWVGDAWAHHQHHTVSDPPVEHLHDIVVNATRFHDRWGVWPMPGWLALFAARGLIAWHADDTTCRVLPAPTSNTRTAVSAAG